MLKEIVKVKGYRLDSAKRALAEAKSNLERCEKALDDHNKAVEEYRDFMKKEKIRLFSEIENEEVSLKEIDEYQLEISLMKQHLAEMVKKTVEFEDAVKNAEEQLTQSRQRYRKCNADLQKYEEVEEEMSENERLLHEYKEEVELEDRVHKDLQV